MQDDPLAGWLAHFAPPDAAKQHKRMPKTQLVQHGGLSKPEQRLLAERVDHIDLRYVIKPAQLNTQAYKSAEHEYLELAVLHIAQRATGQEAKLAAALQRAIPYAAVLAFSHGPNLRLHLAEKRQPRAADQKTPATKLVVEANYDTGPLLAPGQPGEATFWQQQFWPAFALPNCRRSNLRVLYQDLCAAVLALNCAEATGEFRLSDPAFGQPLAQRRERLAHAHELQRQLKATAKQIKAEADFARKLALNEQHAALRRQHAAALKQL